MARKNEEPFFNVILDSIADGVFTADQEGRITFMNKAGQEITGFSSREAIGHYSFDIFRVGHLPQTRCVLKETLRTKREITNLSVAILRKDGKKIPVSIRTAVLRNTPSSTSFQTLPRATARS
jgi:PAS domain S-box-containing protein